MSTIDPGFAIWLANAALYTSSTSSSMTTKWGALAIESDVQSPIASATDAATEAALQQALLAGPLVQDKHLVPGLRNDLRGQCVTLTTDRLGYDAGINCFVIGAEEQSDADTTILTVLRPL